MPNPVAYLIICHTDPAQLERLIDAVDEQADFFIHVDSKVPIEQFAFLAARPNVFFTAERVWIYWAGFSMVRATLTLMSAAVEKGHYRRMVLLGGLDYPIKPTAQILDVLLGDDKREFIRFFDIVESGEEVYLELIERHWFFDAPRLLVNKYYDVRGPMKRLLWPLKKRHLPGYRLCFGHMQWALTGDCASYVLEHARTHPELEKFYRYAFAPDEQFIHTIVANSRFCENAGGIEPYREMGTYRMANLHHIHPSLSKTYTIEDFDEVAASDKLFVKKITSADSAELIERIDAELR